MHPYSNTSLTTTGIATKDGENYADLTDHDLNHQIYVNRPILTPIQSWMASAPNELQPSSYNQLYNNSSSYISSSSSSSSVSTGCMPSTTTGSSYPHLLLGGSSANPPSLSSSQSQTQLRNSSMVPESYTVPNGEFQSPNNSLLMSSYDQDYSPSPSPPHCRNSSIASDSSNQDYEEKISSRNAGGKAPTQKREKALERNRQAALRCRQRKKEWLNQLQSNVEVLTKENRLLEQQSLSLREEILNLKTILLAHRDCSHAHITAGSITFDNFIYRRPSSTTASNSPTAAEKTTGNSLC